MFYSSSKIKLENNMPGTSEIYQCKYQNGFNHKENQNNMLNKIKQFGRSANYLLSKFCQLRLGDLNSNQLSQKYKNIQVIQFILKEIIKLQQTNSKLNNYCKKTDQFLLERQQILQKITKDQKNIQAQKQSLTIKKQKIERIYKQNTQKLILQKDQLQKQVKKIQTREKTIQAQFRKKDNQIKSLQDGIKKLQQKNQSKTHNFQICNRIQYNDYKHKNNSINQYDMITLQKFQQTLKQLKQQNIQLKRYFISFLQQLNLLFEVANLRIKNNQNQIKIIKPQILLMPIQTNEKTMKEIIKNLDKLKNIIKQENETFNKPILQNSGTAQDFKVKQLLQNYKQIIRSQQEIINKIKPNSSLQEGQQQEYDCPILKNSQFDKVKIMVKQQIGVIQSKNRQLLNTKLKFQQDLNQIQCIKKQLLKEKLILQGQF